MGVECIITHQKTEERVASIAILGTFTPRRCGIATFTADLAAALSNSRAHIKVDAIAMSDQHYAYPSQVIEDIAVDDRHAYSFAAETLNRQGYDVLSVQHEYGIFGGVAGEYLLQLIRAANMPVVTTLHTVLRNPSPDQRAVMRELLELSTRVVVMSRTAIDLLSEVDGVNLDKVDYIPHGIPKIPASAGVERRKAMGGKGPILLTFGLLSPDKGIQHVIAALPKLVAAYPDTKYLIVGTTHPHVRAKAGETYRQSLMDLAVQLGVEDNIEFVNEFVSIDELVEYLSATQFYITPYLNPMQITSGTLAYSLGAGKVVISTPYEYAKEVLADERGILVPFADPDAIAEAILASCADEAKHAEMAANAAAYASEMHWERVAELYLQSFNRAIQDSRCVPDHLSLPSAEDFPEVHLDHLRRLSDDTGILQHATFTVPNRQEGYCVDDNARALLLTVALEGHKELHSQLGALQSTYLAFVASAFNADLGKFRNFMSYQRDWLEECGSEDSQGRTMWALGVTAGRSRNVGHADLAASLFLKAAAPMQRTKSPRTWAYTLLGAAAFLERFPASRRARILVETMACLLDHATARLGEAWPWPEERLAYANARIPQAMMIAGDALSDAKLTAKGLQALKWLMNGQVAQEGGFCPVGSEGAGPGSFGSVQFDQQPVEVASSVSACLSAHQFTGDPRFLTTARWCFEWFHGRNVLGIPIADPATGGCRDGLHADRVNQNQGAESTLSYLTALAELRTASHVEPQLALLRASS